MGNSRDPEALIFCEARDLRRVRAMRGNHRDINLLRTGESVDTHSRTADKEARPQGGMDEVFETRVHGRVGRWYYRTLRDPQRPRAKRDPQYRHVPAGARPRPRSKAMGA